MSTMLLEKLVGRLRVAECCGGVEAVANGVERLLLMEEQWEVRRRHQCCNKQRSSEGSDKHNGSKEGIDIDDESAFV